MPWQAALNTVYYLYPLHWSCFFGTGHVTFSEPHLNGLFKEFLLFHCNIIGTTHDIGMKKLSFKERHNKL